MMVALALQMVVFDLRLMVLHARLILMLSVSGDALTWLENCLRRRVPQGPELSLRLWLAPARA